MRMIVIQSDVFEGFFKEAIDNMRIERGKVEYKAGKNKMVTDAVAELHDAFTLEVRRLKTRIESR